MWRNAGKAPERTRGFADDHTATPLYTILYVQVLLAIAVGILIGHFFPEIGVAFKPLGDGFISLIKMMIAPVIFCTVVHGLNKVMANPVALGEAFEEQPG